MGLVTFVNVLDLYIWPFDDDSMNRVEVLLALLVVVAVALLVAVLVVNDDGIARVMAAAYRRRDHR